MSHFKLLVYHNEKITISELMKPFSNDLKVEEMNPKKKMVTIMNEKSNIRKMIYMYEKYQRMNIVPKETKERWKKNKKYLEEVETLDDDTILKFAFKDYDKSLISESGESGYYNPYGKYKFYETDSKYSKHLVVEDKENPGEFIHVNTAKMKDIVWDKLKYKGLYVENILTIDGVWYDQENNRVIHTKKISDGKYEFKESKISNDLRLRVNPELYITIVDCYY